MPAPGNQRGPESRSVQSGAQMLSNIHRRSICRSACIYSYLYSYQYSCSMSSAHISRRSSAHNTPGCSNSAVFFETGIQKFSQTNENDFPLISRWWTVASIINNAKRCNLHDRVQWTLFTVGSAAVWLHKNAFHLLISWRAWNALYTLLQSLSLIRVFALEFKKFIGINNVNNVY